MRGLLIEDTWTAVWSVYFWSPTVISEMLTASLDLTGAAGRNGYLDVMVKMADKYKKKMWGYALQASHRFLFKLLQLIHVTNVPASPLFSWLWTEAGAQMDLEASLGIGGFGYPAMAAINTRKMKFALLRGSFSETGIHEFLR